MVAERSIGLGGVTNLSVLAPIRSGLVPGFEPISYLERLRKVLKALHAARQNVRESELLAPVFPDAIGQFGIIHDFRYAIVPPYPEPAADEAPGVHRLSLNVTFDGGWEPYMRVIYRDIGTLLDLLFCHCDGYPGSRKAGFDDYCRWVRAHEVDGGTFYVDSAMTLGDQHYLAAVERIQREEPDRARAELAVAGFSTPSARHAMRAALAAALAQLPGSLALPLRTLKGLYRLSPLFPEGADDGGDSGTLIRFAQALLSGFRQVVANPQVQDSETGKKIRAMLKDELAWLNRPQPAIARPGRLSFDAKALQAQVLGDGPVTHGCVVLLAVDKPDAAIKFLAGQAGACGPQSPNTVRSHVAFTHAGLQTLGIHEGWLNALPQEFVDGMEARSALLGDVRGNHPDHWRRPLRDGPKVDMVRIDLAAVHVVVVLRLFDAATDSADMHPKLAKTVRTLHANSGLKVLAVEPTRNYRDEGLQSTVEHFGFADGFSQPVVVPGPPKPGSDEVRPGELLLGHGNDRGDGPIPERAHALLDDGSFLVMRKLRQRVDHLDEALAGMAQQDRDELLARMMGRRQDGTPLAGPHPRPGGNDFDFESPADHLACPFQSHVRRANPRDGRRQMPRILRRGMSYGPLSLDDRKTERGTLFMAYCASIAEQFEVIQRWIAGGNSSGGSSSQSDPFLGVPRAGEKRIFRCVDGAGQVVRVDLGDRAFVELEWGLYLFVPSLTALKALADRREPPGWSDRAPARPAKADPFETGRRVLDDADRAPVKWSRVRANGGKMDFPRCGQLLGTHERILAAMKDDGKAISVQGYGQRMAASIGENLLGLDPDQGHTAQAKGLNAAILKITAQEAFERTWPIVTEALKTRFMPLPPLHAGDPPRIPIDLISLSEHVLAALCTHWVGLPEAPAAIPPGAKAFMVPGGRVDGPSPVPRCPGHFFTTSRYIFSPHPRKALEKAGRAQGKAVLAAVENLLGSDRPLGPLAKDIIERLDAVDAIGDADRPAVIAKSLAGVLLGFPPTVHGNLMRTLETWIDEQTLWVHQQALAAQPPADDAAGHYRRAEKALLEPLLATMRKRPVPEMLWRSEVVDRKVVTRDDKRIILGIASALTDELAPNELMWGQNAPGQKPTVHGCPGMEMSKGVMLAILCGLLDAGTLRPTGSPVLLILSPRGS